MESCVTDELFSYHKLCSYVTCIWRKSITPP